MLASTAGLQHANLFRLVHPRLGGLLCQDQFVVSSPLKPVDLAAQCDENTTLPAGKFLEGNFDWGFDRNSLLLELDERFTVFGFFIRHWLKPSRKRCKRSKKDFAKKSENYY